jgi:hypothetical protein
MLRKTTDTPDIRQLIRQNVTLVPGVTNVYALEVVPLVNGTSLQYSCWVLARDAVVVDDISNYIQEGGARVTTGVLAPITVNRTDKRQVGGANTFPTDVDWLVTSAAGGQLVLAAINNAIVDRVGSFVIRWWTARLPM